MMNWTDVKTNWKDVKKNFQTKWSKLTDADLTKIAGKREELLPILKKHYAKDEVKLGKEVDDFIQTLKKPAKV